MESRNVYLELFCDQKVSSCSTFLYVITHPTPTLQFAILSDVFGPPPIASVADSSALKSGP